MKTIKFLFVFGGVSRLRHCLEFAQHDAPRAGRCSGTNWLPLLSGSLGQPGPDLNRAREGSGFAGVEAAAADSEACRW